MNDNDFEKILDEAEREGIKMSQGLSKMLMAMWKNAADDLKAATAAANRLRLIAWIAAVLAALCLACCVYMGNLLHKQSGEIEAIHRILDQGVTVEESVTTVTEETTSQTVEGDTATINNGKWTQYNGGDGD